MVKGQPERASALDEARRDIAARIARVCTQFDRAEFARLVDQMADIEVRYRVRSDWLSFAGNSNRGRRELSTA